METILIQLSAELRGLGDSVGAVELAVQHFVAKTGHADNGAIRELQNIDLIGQSLQNLTDFVSSLAREVPADWSIDVEPALRSISLQAVADRLGRPPNSQVRETVHQSGDFDVF